MLARLKRDEGGYIVVETISGFVLFVLLMAAILSLVNLVGVQNRVHYALTQTAQELSMYSYVLEATGAADVLKDAGKTAGKVRADIGKFQENLDGVLAGIESVSPSDIYNHGSAGYGQVEAWLDNPRQTIKEFFYLGVDEASSALSHRMIEVMFRKYLANGSQDPDAYLKGWQVIGGLEGLDFSESVFIDVNGDIELVVTYDIDYTFGALPLPFRKLHVRQVAKTKAWLGGNGKGYGS